MKILMALIFLIPFFAHGSTFNKECKHLKKVLNKSIRTGSMQATRALNHHTVHFCLNGQLVIANYQDASNKNHYDSFLKALSKDNELDTVEKVNIFCQVTKALMLQKMTYENAKISIETLNIWQARYQGEDLNILELAQKGKRHPSYYLFFTEMPDLMLRSR